MRVWVLSALGPFVFICVARYSMRFTVENSLPRADCHISHTLVTAQSVGEDYCHIPLI